MTSRCRTSDPGYANGSSVLYLGSQAPTSPGVSISRSRPPDSQINSRQMLVVGVPESGDSHLQVCFRRPAEKLIESADPQSQKKPSAPSPTEIRTRNDGQSYGYGSEWFPNRLPYLVSKLLVKLRDCSFPLL